ncbi:hypothetical protein JVT61DRAFT_9263 [Boletus reticuloceps]|uniref:Protein kinase domain-containing protein n=1 Tax=Boletus reticuloceps TaxID=495285 RepID=A0A8I2YH11_9AGAM|nr:hypothetical protein JVT61DRAFT_9263 [Boletus reticuloceps]
MEFVEDACEITKSSYAEKHGEWVTQLRNLVQAFHRQGLVHGDLRSRSIICDGQRIMLVGFDLSGKLGSATYPVSSLTQI